MIKAHQNTSTEHSYGASNMQAQSSTPAPPPSPPQKDDSIFDWKEVATIWAAPEFWQLTLSGAKPKKEGERSWFF